MPYPRPNWRVTVMAAIFVAAAACRPAIADDLSYLDARLPFAADNARDRLARAIACTNAGDGRCYLFVVAEILRSFRNGTGPLPALAQANMGYFIHAAGRWDRLHHGRADNYAHLASAIYYGHRSCMVEDSLGVPGAITRLADVDADACGDARCRADVAYYATQLKTFLRKACL